MKRNIHRFFDFLGFPAFAFLLVYAIFVNSKLGPSFLTIFAIIVCSIGMLIDGYLIFIYKEK